MLPELLNDGAFAGFFAAVYELEMLYMQYFIGGEHYGGFVQNLYFD